MRRLFIFTTKIWLNKLIPPPLAIKIEKGLKVHNYFVKIIHIHNASPLAKANLNFESEYSLFVPNVYILGLADIWLLI